MKIKIKVEQEFDIKYLQVSAGVRYWEDATVDGAEDEDGTLIPCRQGDRWEPRIDVETGQIVNWDIGKTAEVHYKVADEGKYSLLSESGSITTQFEGYVPDALCPKGNGYGDYIIMDIDANGMIQNWKFIVSSFLQEDEDEYED